MMLSKAVTLTILGALAIAAHNLSEEEMREVKDTCTDAKEKIDALTNNVNKKLGFDNMICPNGQLNPFALYWDGSKTVSCGFANTQWETHGYPTIPGIPQHTWNGYTEEQQIRAGQAHWKNIFATNSMCCTGQRTGGRCVNLKSWEDCAALRERNALCTKHPTRDPNPAMWVNTQASCLYTCGFCASETDFLSQALNTLKKAEPLYEAGEAAKGCYDILKEKCESLSTYETVLGFSLAPLKHMGYTLSNLQEDLRCSKESPVAAPTQKPVRSSISSPTPRPTETPVSTPGPTQKPTQKPVSSPTDYPQCAEECTSKDPDTLKAGDVVCQMYGSCHGHSGQGACMFGGKSALCRIPPADVQDVPDCPRECKWRYPNTLKTGDVVCYNDRNCYGTDGSPEALGVTEECIVVGGEKGELCRASDVEYPDCTEECTSNEMLTAGDVVCNWGYGSCDYIQNVSGECTMNGEDAVCRIPTGRGMYGSSDDDDDEGMNKGVLAAAVVVPLVLIACIASGLSYVYKPACCKSCCGEKDTA